MIDIAVCFPASCMTGPGDGAVASDANFVITGELCDVSAPTLEEAFNHVIGPHGRAVTVDLSGLELCTTAGIAVLAQARGRLDAQAGSLRIRGATGIVAKVLDICGIVHEAGVVTTRRLGHAGRADQRRASMAASR